MTSKDNLPAKTKNKKQRRDVFKSTNRSNKAKESRVIKDAIRRVDKMEVDLMKFVNKWNWVQANKEYITLEDLNKRYKKFGRKYLTLRNKFHRAILADTTLYKVAKSKASQSLLFDILIDGWSYDVNRTKAGGDPTMPFIPFPHQLKLIEAFEDDKHIHIEKARRQGASVLARHNMKRDLVHGRNIFAVATHKDIEGLDGMEEDIAKNSTFEGVRWLLDKSLWIPSDWQNGKKYWNRNDKTQQYYHTEHKKIVIAHKVKTRNGWKLIKNSLHGAVLGKGTNVGAASTKIYTDEIDVVEDMFPNKMKGALGAFAMSVNQVIALSTYRSNEGSFYGIKAQNDTNEWNFITLDWRENPICNREWYNSMRSKLGQDEVLIARELDMDPTKSRRGLILPDMAKERHFANFSLLNKNKMTKVIGADFGGGTSNTVFIAGYFDHFTGRLYLEHMLSGTKFGRHDIGRWARKIGFHDVTIRGDQSGLSEASTNDSSWAKIIRENGMKFKPVNNKNTLYQHSHMNIAFEEDKIYISSSNPELWNDLSNANYKLGKINKDKFSHTFDAFMYLFKSLNGPLGVELIDI